MRHVLLDFGKHKSSKQAFLTWEMAYVAISRAVSDNDLRLALLNEGESFDHIPRLKPMKVTIDYYDDKFWVPQHGGWKRKFPDDAVPH
jgi:hypothetical protein